MTVDTRTPITGFRFAETFFGDSLQTIAARELGDGKRWVELVSYNSLIPPYITSDPAAVQPGILLTGALILVPAATASAITTDESLVFERDIHLVDGQIQFTDGDFAFVSGVANLRQALRHRVETDQGELIMHPEYGSKVRRLIGTINGPTAGLLAAEYTKAAVAQDPRIQTVRSATADIVGDRVDVTVVAEPITGRAIDISTSL
ncbi:MAG: hypothetical protein AB9M53_00930 [Leptothrix sp. (in: b-proteobacteria)]